MKNLQGILGVLFILAFSGCSALSVDSYYDPSASFTGLKKYGWLPALEEMIDDPRIDQGLLSSRIQAAGKMDGRQAIDEGQRQFQSTGPTRIFYQLSK